MSIPLFTLPAGTTITSQDYDERGCRMMIRTAHPDEGSAIWAIAIDPTEPHGVRVEKTCIAPDATVTLTVGHQK